MDYIEGFVAAVPTENKEKYIQHATEAAALFKEHGAKKLIECWGDDVPEGEVTSFPKAVKCKANETVVFSWVVWPSKSARDSGIEKVMKDERMNNQIYPMPFDGSRLIYGGFQMIVNE